MTFLANILVKLGGQRIEDAERSESSGAAMGGAASATGTDETETSVGRVAGQDEGYLDSGADHRGG
jgi:hypothetical protein